MIDEKMKGLTLRQKLDIIDGWLCELGARDLADVLSAIRGPDSENDGLKSVTTMVIRTAAFPKTAAESTGWNQDYTGWMFAMPEDVYQNPIFTEDSWHFRHHAELAAKALGIYRGE